MTIFPAEDLSARAERGFGKPSRFRCRRVRGFSLTSFLTSSGSGGGGLGVGEGTLDSGLSPPVIRCEMILTGEDGEIDMEDNDVKELDDVEDPEDAGERKGVLSVS